MQYNSRKDTLENVGDNPPPERLGSARADNDPISSASPSTGEVPSELIASESRPVEVFPVEGIPVETQAMDYMTLDARPQEIRPREGFPTEGR